SYHGNLLLKSWKSGRKHLPYSLITNPDRGGLRRQTDLSNLMGESGELMGPTTVPPPMRVAKSYDQFCAEALKKILVISQESIQKRNHCNIALSGGSTPQGVYSLMASPP